MPAELESAPPRRVSRRPGTWWRVYGVRLWVLLFAALGACIFIPLIPEPWLLAKTPPIQARISLVTSRRGSKGGVTYHVTYQYQPADPGDQAGWLEGSSRITEEEYHDLYRRPSVMIHAARIGPFHVTTLDRTPREYLHARGFEWGFLLIWNGVMWFALFSVWIGPRRARQLLREGQPVAGRITGKRTNRGRTTNYVIAYEYPLPIAPRETYRRARTNVNKRDYERSSEGQRIVVLYDPHKPARHVVYDFCEYFVGR